MSIDSFGAKDSLEVNGTSYAYYRLDKVPGQEHLPYSSKVPLENLLRTEDVNITHDDIAFLGNRDAAAEPDHEIQFTPARHHAGLHRRPVRRRPWPPCARRWPTWVATRQDQPTVARRNGHRPLRHRRRLRHP